MTPTPARLSVARWTLLFVLVVTGVSFFWWFRHRPSYLLYQSTKDLKDGNQAALIANYKSLLSKKDLPAEEEKKLRKALGDLYMRAFQGSSASSFYSRGMSHIQDPLRELARLDFETSSNAQHTENPFLGLAKKEFDRVLEIDSSDSAAHCYLGRILWIRGLEPYAMKELELSRKADPKNPEPLYFLGVVNLQRGNAKLARDYSLEALSIVPSYEDARWVLIQAYNDLGDWANAEDHYSRLSDATRSDPQVMAFRALYLAGKNEWAEAESALDTVLRTQPDNSIGKRAAAQYFLERGQLEDAAAFAAQATALDPDDISAMIIKTQILAQRGECDAAAQVSQALVNDPLGERTSRWAWSYMINAWIQLCRGESDRAIASLDEAHRLAPNLFDAVKLKAELLLDEGRLSELGDLVRPLLSEKIREGTAYVFLAKSFEQGKNRLLTQEMAQSAIKLEPWNAEAYAVLGQARAQLKDQEGARWSLKMAAAYRPFDNAIVARQAFVEAVYFSSPTAPAVLAEIARKDRRNPSVALTWADWNLRKENYGDAAAAYQNAISLKPYLLAAHLGLIESLWKSGARDAADAALSAALSVNAKHDEVLAWRTKIRGSRT